MALAFQPSEPAARGGGHRGNGGAPVLADGSGVSAVDPIASACFRLGWCMEELFSQFDVPERPPRAYDLAHLPGLSKLSSYDWQRLGLDQVDFVLSQVTANVGTPAAVPLNLTVDTRTKLEATIEAGEGAASRRQAYREALSKLHVDLLVTLTAAAPSYGKAYGLGRALADTTCPHQTPEQLATSFDRHRIGQIYVWRDELASLLPEHAARAVAKSLDWWQQAVTAALSGSPLRTDAIPATYLAGQPSQRSQWRKAMAALPPRRQHPGASDTVPPAIEVLAAAVARQGAVWRTVLDGDKRCIDLLNSTDYLRAGDRLAHHYAHLVGRALRTMPWLIFLLLFLLVTIVLVLVFIPGSAVARTATAVATIAGTLSGIWKIIRTRIAPIAAQLEGPLWGTELNTATAEAVTVPPVGTPQDPAWETAFRHEATPPAAAQAP
jgi:hypothetical protein